MLGAVGELNIVPTRPKRVFKHLIVIIWLPIYCSFNSFTWESSHMAIGLAITIFKFSDLDENYYHCIYIPEFCMWCE